MKCVLNSTSCVSAVFLHKCNMFVSPSLQVNSEVVSSTIDRFRVLTPFKIDKDFVGKAVLTKSIGSRNPENITLNYKYPKGNATGQYLTWASFEGRTSHVGVCRESRGPHDDDPGPGIRFSQGAAWAAWDVAVCWHHRSPSTDRFSHQTVALMPSTS